MNIDKSIEELITATFTDAYKAGFDHGVKCDRDEIENLNNTASAIRMFDYHLEHHIRNSAERYVMNKLKGEQ